MIRAADYSERSQGMDGNVGVALRRWGALLATCGLLILGLLATAGSARAAVGDVYVADPFSNLGSCRRS